MHEYEDRNRSAGMIYILLVVVAVAFGGFVWQLYTSPEIPRIAADSGPYKSSPSMAAAEAPEPEPVQAAAAPPAAAPARAADILGPASAEAAAPAPRAPAGPRFVSTGPFVAQLAALQSEAGVQPAWNRLASRAPDLFAQARLDVERADLGPRGVYHRVRAGYFASREDANRFCDRIRPMGQDCIVVAR